MKKLSIILSFVLLLNHLGFGQTSDTLTSRQLFEIECQQFLDSLRAQDSVKITKEEEPKVLTEKERKNKTLGIGIAVFIGAAFTAGLVTFIVSDPEIKVRKRKLHFDRQGGFSYK